MSMFLALYLSQGFCQSMPASLLWICNLVSSSCCARALVNDGTKYLCIWISSSVRVIWRPQFLLDCLLPEVLACFVELVVPRALVESTLYGELCDTLQYIPPHKCWSRRIWSVVSTTIWVRIPDILSCRMWTVSYRNMRRSPHVFELVMCSGWVCTEGNSSSLFSCTWPLVWVH